MPFHHPVRSALRYVFLSASAMFADVVDAQTIRTDTFITNGSVNAIALSGNTLYIGGSFTQVGPATGCFVALDSTTAARLPFPLVSGTINTAISDGSGGWYLGGTFNAVGGIPRNNLAHVTSGGTVSAWDPAPNNTVNDIKVSGSTVYIGGRFTSVGGASRSRIAALDAATGLATAWDPNANFDVLEVEVTGSTVYAAGQFNTIGGAARNSVAALDATTGLASAWNPAPNNQVVEVELSGSTVYVAGFFTSVGGALRNRVAALDATTGLATAWDPNANNQVGDLEVSGSTIYVCGFFTSVGGAIRNSVAALDATTGLATGWNPNVPMSQVTDLEVHGSTVYFGGSFSTVGGMNRNRIAAVDITTGIPTAWNPNANSNVNEVEAIGSTVYIGGSFSSLGATTRNNIAALDGTTGAVTAWDPNANSQVSDIEVAGSTVYVGGVFIFVGGAARNRIAALDATTGLATAWNPNANSTVSDVEVSGSIVYVGGAFSNVGGAARNAIASLDAATGLATAWNPSAAGQVSAVEVVGTTVYVGGTFGSIGGAARNRIAALDAVTGLATAWNPNANNQVLDVEVVGSTVYICGSFTSVGAASRPNLAAVDATTGTATPWNPIPSSQVSEVEANCSVVYVGGFFNSVGGAARNRIAALSASTGVASSWNPDAGVGGGVVEIVITDSTILAGGPFQSMGGWPLRGVALISPAVNTAPQLASVPPQTVLEDELLTVPVSASDAENDALTYDGLGLPAGATVDPSTGTLTWTPDYTQAGNASVQIVVSDCLLSDTVQVEITVNDVPPGALILGITDIGNDQGRQVDVQWRRSQYDDTGDGIVITGYALYRRIDPLPSAPGLILQADTRTPSPRPLAAMYPPGSWQYVLTAPARLESDYHVVAPTLADSTIANGMHQSVFFVSALSTNPEQFYDGAPDSGYSLDNLAPGAPPFLLAEAQASGGVAVGVLTWGHVHVADFDYYAIFRGQTLNFVPSPVNQIGTTTDSTFVDGDPSNGDVYKVGAVDFSGNMGVPAVAVMDLTGINPGEGLTLRVLVKNPARGRGDLSVMVPERGWARLDVFSLDGRRVRRLQDGVLEAGVHPVPWNLVDDGGRTVAPGIYFVQLDWGGTSLTRKLTVMP